MLPITSSPLLRWMPAPDRVLATYLLDASLPACEVGVESYSTERGNNLLKVSQPVGDEVGRPIHVRGVEVGNGLALGDIRSREYLDRTPCARAWGSPSYPSHAGCQGFVVGRHVLFRYPDHTSSSQSRSDSEGVDGWVCLNTPSVCMLPWVGQPVPFHVGVRACVHM